MVFIPLLIILFIGKALYPHIEDIRELFDNEDSIVNNIYYQLSALGIVLLIIYVLTSFVLSGFIIWKYKVTLKFPYENISNRGGRITFPGNTIEAFKRAVKNGAQVILIDVQLTKDKKVVVFQYDDFSKINGKTSKVKYLNYAELPLLKLSKEQLELNENRNIKPQQLEIPLLDNVFKQFPSVPFIINLNDDSTELADKVNALVLEHDREDLTIWGSFKYESVGKYLFKLNEKVHLFFSKSTIGRIIFYDFMFLLPFIKINESVYITTQRTEDVKGYALLKSGLSMHLNARGIPVFVYSDIVGEMDDMNVIDRVRKIRVNGIIADDSKSLADYLAYIVEQKKKELEEKKREKNLNANIKENNALEGGEKEEEKEEEIKKEKSKEEKKNE